MTKAEAIRLVSKIRAAFPRWTVTDDTVEMYAGGLEDISFEYADIGLKNLVKKAKYPPTVAELRDAADAATPKVPYSTAEDDRGPLPQDVRDEALRLAQQWRKTIGGK